MTTDKEKKLLEACEEYWEYRRKLYEGKKDLPQGTGTRAKMKMYKAMAALWGGIKDYYGGYL